MRVPWRAGLSAFVFLSLVFFSLVLLSSDCVGQASDRALAEQVLAGQVLGPQWTRLSKAAGMIFAGTVVMKPASPESTGTTSVVAGVVPAVTLTFRVDEAIAGVERGQVVTIHEWAGAWSMHRPVRIGEHLLIFLYPPSRLGLTSPVGGSSGLVALDASGQFATNRVAVSQLKRAIRRAREE
jgi:hypothetical protein